MQRQRKLTSLMAPLALSILALFVANPSEARDDLVLKTKDVILVHGAWADGSSWSKVIALLERRGFHVTAVQLPLTSVAEDVATLQRAMALDTGPILLVGHSYAGVVITEARNDPKVNGLVYISAYAPDAGQSVFSLNALAPSSPVNHGECGLPVETRRGASSADRGNKEMQPTVRNVSALKAALPPA